MRLAAFLLAISAATLVVGLARSDEPTKLDSTGLTAEQEAWMRTQLDNGMTAEQGLWMRALLEKGKPGDPPDTHRYTVRCRAIYPADGHPDLVMPFPTITLFDGKTGSATVISGSEPFVTGVRQITDPKTKAVRQRGIVTSFDEGSKVDVVVTGWQPNGASVDVTYETTQIGPVNVKEAHARTKNSDAVRVQLPIINTVKMRAVDFAEFGKPIVAPIYLPGETRDEAKTPRLEIIVEMAKDK